MRSSHCIRAATLVLAAALPLAAAAQETTATTATTAAGTGTGAAKFTVFLRGRVIGTEDIATARDANGWTITSEGRLSPPLDIALRRLELRYDADWKPLEMTLDAAVRGEAQNIHTIFNGTTATSEVTIGGPTRTLTATTRPEILLPNPFFGPFEALSRRLRALAPGTVIRGFMPAQSELTILVGDSATETIQTPAQTIAATRTQITITPQLGAAPPVLAEVWADATGRLLRVSIPGQSLEVVREDLASVSTRRVPISRPNDEQVTVADNGFVLKGTLSKPAAAPAPRLPAVVLVAGSGLTDRDEVVAGVPIFGQLADAMANAGFVVLRYDKRGVGQSGGRDEAATLADYADDVRAAVRFLAARKDVDPKRIAVAGYGEGGPVAMIAAAKDKRIAALVLVATIGTTGAELNMEQVRRALDRSNRSEADKQATLEMQKKIQQAVLTGTGWDEVAAYRTQADTPWFQSFLAFDPARTMNDVRQPLFIVQGGVDTEVPSTHANRLQSLANQRKKRPSTDLVVVPAVNHLLVPARTGEADEYSALPDKHVSAEVSGAIVRWLQTVLAK
jgi:pimeloyl-ACP methyl ester carboxylesterase